MCTHHYALAIALAFVTEKCVAAPNIILLSGGPSSYDDKDPELHDKSWDNFVTAPGLMFNAKLIPESSDRREVWWFVYKPAYEARWNDDKNANDFRKQHTENVLKSYSSYVDLIEKKAAERKWRLRWVDSAKECWTRLETFQDPIDELHYWGHASNDLWLTCSHDQSHRASEPSDPNAVIAVTNIANHAGLKNRFAAGRKAPCKFWGCNTAPFAKQWSTTMGTNAIGYKGAITFVEIHKNKGMPSLSKGAEKKEYNAAN